jgi:pSer/pThr/pTyr-binding forkhead associated (FHA) protein
MEAGRQGYERDGVHMSNEPERHARSAPEIKEIIEIERTGVPFVVWRAVSGEQRIVSLGQQQSATIGRGSSCALVLDDTEVSRTHAELERVGDEWAVVDDGLSRNGTFVNGIRISGRKRLADGDVMRFGATTVEYRCPGEPSVAVTSAASFLPLVEALSDTQRRILIALCRPYKAGGGFATPASNSDIAAEVFLSVDAVKTNLRMLFKHFEISDLPQNQKRARLVECAFQLGLVTERDL